MRHLFIPLLCFNISYTEVLFPLEVHPQKMAVLGLGIFSTASSLKDMVCFEPLGKCLIIYTHLIMFVDDRK